MHMAAIAALGNFTVDTADGQNSNATVLYDPLKSLPQGQYFFRAVKKKGKHAEIQMSIADAHLSGSSATLRAGKIHQRQPRAIVQEHPTSAPAQISATATRRVENCM